MPKYLVKEKSVVNGVLYEEGAVVDYTPPEGTTVSSNLEPYKEPKGHHDEDDEKPTTAPQGQAKAADDDKFGKKK